MIVSKTNSPKDYKVEYVYFEHTMYSLCMCWSTII